VADSGGTTREGGIARNAYGDGDAAQAVMGDVMQAAGRKVETLEFEEWNLIFADLFFKKVSRRFPRVLSN
jgi:hypothetical protein